MFNNFSNIAKSIQTKLGILPCQSFFNTLTNMTRSQEHSQESKKYQRIESIFKYQKSKGILINDIIFFKNNSTCNIFMSLSNIMKMAPIYMSIINKNQKDLEDNKSIQTKASTQTENNTIQENPVAFLLALGFSMVSNLFNIPLSTHIPREGETFQANWEDGTSIAWEAIKLGQRSNGNKFLYLLFILKNRVGWRFLTWAFDLSYRILETTGE